VLRRSALRRCANIGLPDGVRRSDPLCRCVDDCSRLSG
jgi:hypothetical protein